MTLHQLLLVPKHWTIFPQNLLTVSVKDWSLSPGGGGGANVRERSQTLTLYKDKENEN